MSLVVVILAAGRGVRMRSTLPKVLHPLGGVPILSRIISTVSQLSNDKIVIVHGHEGAQFKSILAHHQNILWVLQENPQGTAHAVLQALPWLETIDRVLILYGDMPLITVKTLEQLIGLPKDVIGMVTQTLPDPRGFGRVVRDADGRVTRIVEEKDAIPDEKKITEINAGFYILPQHCLQNLLPKIAAANKQQEYYLTDIAALAHQAGISIATVTPEFDWETLGINDKTQLALAERIFQKRQAIQLMEQGVTLLDPNRFDVRNGEVLVGKDVVIDVNVLCEGTVTLGNNVSIGPHVCIKDTVIQDNAQILAHSVIEGAIIGEGCSIGPFARIRPGTDLQQGVKVGNFVEIKNTVVGMKTKINHLSYVGDATLGQAVTVGAGTITCNFDGQKKHKTIIGDRVFIGSDTQLIAPVEVGEDAVIGAGTTVTRNVPARHLVHNRIVRRSIPDWKSKKTEEKQE